MVNSDKSLRCALIFLGPFPLGNVSSIRIMSYCKALAQKGIFVKVLVLAPTAESAVNEFESGNVDGVEYQYMTKVTWKRENTFFVTKLAYYIIGLLKSLRYLRRDNINCLLSYHDEIISNIFYRLVTRFLSIPFVIDKTEYPRNYFMMPPVRRRFERFRLSLFDGFITITNELKEFYFNMSNKKPHNVFLLPMTIDKDRYRDSVRTFTRDPYIAVVFGTHNRDGLYESVLAYHLYRKLCQDKPFDLVLIGDFNRLCEEFPQCKKITDYIIFHGIEKYVKFEGLVPIVEVPDILLSSECLLTTPLRYVSGGFPTKLGEYLLSGVPVVATSAGEINSYITHMEDAFLSSPGDIKSIAENILYIHNNREEAKFIGERGRELASNRFNAETYSADFIDFLTRKCSI